MYWTRIGRRVIYISDAQTFGKNKERYLRQCLCLCYADDDAALDLLENLADNLSTNLEKFVANYPKEGELLFL